MAFMQKDAVGAQQAFSTPHSSAPNPMEALLSTYYKLLRVDLAQDTCEILIDDHSRNVSENSATLSTWLRSFVEAGRVHPDDIADFTRYTKLEYLRGYFERHPAGTSFCLQYRRRTKGVYYWAQMEVVPAEDYTPAHPMAYLMVKNLQNAESDDDTKLWKIFESLCSDYEAICHVNFATGIVMTYRLSDSVQNIFPTHTDTLPEYEEAIRQYVQEQVVPEDRSRMSALFQRENLEKQFLFSPTITTEYRLVREGQQYCYRVRFSNLSEGSTLTRMVLAFTDITEENLLAIHTENRRTVLVIEQASLLSTILQNDYTVLHCTDCGAAEEVFRAHQHEIAAILLDSEVSQNGTLPQELLRFRERTHIGSTPIILAISDKYVDAEKAFLTLGISDFLGAPYRPQIVRNRLESIIRLSASNELLEHYEKDSLTGLYEKKPFCRYAARHVEQNPDHSFSILCSDIEGFKFTNERFGTEKCDEFLAQLSDLMNRELPGVVLGSRLGNDVFAFLLKDGDPDQLSQAVDRIADRMLENDVHVFFGVEPVDPAISISANCDRAKIALETIKGRHRARLARYSESFHKQQLLRQHLNAAAEPAILNEEFQIWYQPKVDVHTLRIGAAEALIRWNHPEMGMVSPGQFIPLFESNGFITRLDEYVCHHVCQDLARWRKEGLPVVPVSVNLSRRDFESPDLAERICAIADQYELPHHLLRFELTESAYATQPMEVARIARQLDEFGFQLELDDFGTGYSSLTSLGALSLSTIKLDKSLIDQMFTDFGDKILFSVIGLSKSLQLQTVAEGVEHKEQLDALQALSCDYIQGYYFFRPMPAEDFHQRLCAEFAAE